jgi:hypothetical protein
MFKQQLKIPPLLVYAYVNVQPNNVNSVNGMSDSLYSLTSLSYAQTKFDTLNSPNTQCLSMLI